MKRFLILAALAALLFAGLGCENPSSLRTYGVAGYKLYTGWIASSPYWPEAVPRLTADQQAAFAEASWAEHERVYAWVDDQIEQGD